MEESVFENRIQILLSTYNGEKYLKEQLDSFLNLDGVNNIKVLIRDDGSTDNTVEILRQYCKQYGFEVVVGENIGINDSMFWLFNHCDLTCNYFAISDQDDVWLKEKLIIALNHLREFNDLKPAMFASCSQIVDEDLHFLGSTEVPQKGVSFFNAMVQNVTPGHTQVFNRAMMLELINNGLTNVHVIDWWLYLVATARGDLVFDRKFTVLHRQHGDNVMGYELNFWERTRRRLKKVNDGEGKRISRQLIGFYNCYKQVLDKEKKREVERFFSYQKNLFWRILYVFTCHVFRQTWYETFAFKVLYILGKYNV